MKCFFGKVVAFPALASILLACQSEPTTDESQAADVRGAPAETQFAMLVDDFLTQCHRDGVESPQEMDRRLALDVVRESDLRREDVEAMGQSEFHPILRHLWAHAEEPGFQPYRLIHRTYVREQHKLRHQAILLLKVLGYESPETYTISFPPVEPK